MKNELIVIIYPIIFLICIIFVWVGWYTFIRCMPPIKVQIVNIDRLAWTIKEKEE